MRVRSIVPVALTLALAATGRAGDTEKPAAPAKPAVATKSDRDAKPAEPKKPAAEPSLVLARPAPKTLDEAMLRLGRVKVTVTFKDTAFTECVDYLRRVAGFNVIVAPVLQAKGIDGIRPITMQLHDVSLKQIAELVAQFTGTKLKLDDGVLQFTTPEDARGKPVLRIYAIGDVTMRLHNFPGPDINLHSSKAEFEPEPETDVGNAWSDPQKVVDMIQKIVAEDTWSDKDVSISADENKLIVKQYPEVHREIARLISMLRAAR
jgi:hypothetical protein